MKKSYRSTKLFKTMAGIAAASLLGLTVSASMVNAFDASISQGQVYGVGLTGSFSFDKLSLTGFSHTPSGLSGSSGGSPFFHIQNGVAVTEIPLVTFGDDVVYPGIFYNSGDVQFHSLVANAAEGDADATATVTMYAAAAGAAIAFGIVALDSTSGGSNVDCVALSKKWIADNPDFFELKKSEGEKPVPDGWEEDKGLPGECYGAWSKAIFDEVKPF